MLALVLPWLALAGCPRKAPGLPAAPPGMVLAYSEALGIRVSYDPSLFTTVEQRADAEFPLRFLGESYSLGIKRLGRVGAMLAKPPGTDFFVFYAQQVRYDLIEGCGLKPLEPEVNEEFTAQGAPGLRQVLHFQNPEDPKTVPRFAPPEPGAEFYLYYHHFYYEPDYYFFVAVSRRELTEEEKAGIIAFIDRTQFGAQPTEE